MRPRFWRSGHLPEKPNLGEQILETVKDHPKSNCMAMEQVSGHD